MIRKILGFFEPFILCLLGTVLLASFLPAQGIGKPFFSTLAHVAIVLLFFLHGARLPVQSVIDGLRKWQLHLATLATTFALFPLLGLLFGSFSPLSEELQAGFLFLTLLPSTVQSSIAFTALARGNVPAAVFSASFSNLVGMFATPLLVAVLLNVQGEVSSGTAIKLIVFQLFAPFLAGQLCRPFIGSFVERQKKLTTMVDRGSILLVVYTAFSAAVLEGLWHIVSPTDLAMLLALCVALLSIVLTITWYAGALLGFERADRIVLMFCGSKKSLATGVPMAGVLFTASSVGVMILPLMLFHQIQLIACALLARRLAAASDDEAESALTDRLETP